MKKFTIIAAILGIIFSANIIKAEDDNGPALDVGADIMSRYVWRGLDYSSSPSIQPTIEFSAYGFSIGYWGAFTTNGLGAQEADLYLGYTIVDMFYIGATDYFFPMAETMNSQNYFEYDEDLTGHVFEVNAGFTGTEKIPVSLMFNYNFYGSDANNSVYIELAYNGKIGDNAFDVFLGITTDQGIYGNDFGVVNFGITGHKEVEITDKFTLPVQASFITNPQAENIYLVFGFSL
jgi:hypothetical protein